MKMSHAEFNLTDTMVVRDRPVADRYEPTEGSLLDELRLLGDVMQLDRLGSIFRRSVEQTQT